MVRKNAKGEIEYLMKSGKDMVRSATLESNIRRMIDEATTVEKSDEFEGFPLCINGKFYFPEIPEKPAPAPVSKPKRKR